MLYETLPNFTIDGAYSYRLVQYHNIDTAETINLGVLVERNNDRDLRLIDDIKALNGCIAFENAEGIEFVLQILHNKLASGFVPGQIANGISITPPRTYISEKKIDEVTDELFNAKISLRIARKQKKVNIYDKPHIFKHIKDVFVQKKPKGVSLNKKIDGVHKNIDVVVERDKHVIIAAEVESIYTSTFFSSLAESILLFQEVKMVDSHLKEAIVYIPIFDDLNPSQKRLYQKAKSILRYNNIKHLDTNDYDEFFGYLEEASKRYGVKLL